MRTNSNSTPHSKPADFEGGTISDQSRLLATKLSSHMGIENALQVSVRNQWHSVVAALNEIKLGRNQRR